MPTRVDPGKYPARLGLERGDRELLRRIDDVDQVPGRGGLLGRRGLRGADVEVPVHGHRIHRDQLVAVRGRPGQLERERRLAGAGRAHDHDAGRVGASEVFQSASSAGRWPAMP